jgi:hypothetical protein
MTARRSYEAALSRVASGAVDAAAAAALSSPAAVAALAASAAMAAAAPAAAMASAVADVHHSFVKAEVVELQVGPDDSQLSLRLSVPLEALDLRSAQPLSISALAVNGVSLGEMRVQSPRSAVDSQGRPSFEVLVTGQVERTVARDMRAMTTLSVEGTLDDGRFLAAFKA